MVALTSALVMLPTTASAKTINTDSKSTIFSRQLSSGSQDTAKGIAISVSGISTSTPPPKVPVKVCDGGYQYEPTYDVCAKYTDSSYVCEGGYNLKGELCEGMEDITPWSLGDSVGVTANGSNIIWRINGSIKSREIANTIQYKGKTYGIGTPHSNPDDGSYYAHLAVLTTKDPSYSCPFGYKVYQDTCRTTKPYKIEYQ
ncbi:hypothetical protein QX249_12525 [Vibrio parahaemolyticus]|uniref:Secreted protein n=1 Tax=Vibrio parahaemolyticus TaxID=670 RepID=A0AAW8Q1J4_VIBPH|nr:hypothetical protein [Vibrio parahaemolyticus]MDS1821489.1 hypothetical protein [Vibrio parahaemolyticus]